MKLSISVALLPKLLPAQWTSRPAVAVVIDTLRFSSTACVALEAGSKGITVVSDIEQAKRLAGSFSDGGALLCGERSCVRIPGFDLGNSPAEYVAKTVKNRELIFSTTNGTVAVEASQGAQEIVLGSLLNRSALCRWLAESAEQIAGSGQPLEVWCVCAGTDGQVALEDVLTAGAIMEGLVAIAPECLMGNDSSALALAAWEDVARDDGVDGDESAGKNLLSRLLTSMCMSLGGRNLMESGFEDDLRLVCAVDSLTVVPRQESACRFTR